MAIIKDPKLDEQKMIEKADYEVKSRDFINNYGSQYGITNDMIGWDNDRQMIKLGEDDLIKADRVESGRSWNSNEQLRTALDNYAKQRGIQAQGTSLQSYGATDVYRQRIDSMLDGILNAPKFNYSAESDPSFQAYKDQYGRAGDRAMANTMSEASAMTGGRLNSWAVSAGQGAKSQYDQQLMSIVPQLEQAAYARHQDGINSKRQNLNTLLDLDDNLVRRAMEERNFQYGVGRDKVADSRYSEERDYGRGVDQRDFAYKQGRDTIGDDQWRKSFNESVRQNKDASARGWASNNLANQQFEWNKSQDTIANNLRKEQWEYEKAARETGTDVQTLGGIYSAMMSSEDPSKWLATEAQYMTNDELLAIQKLLPKGENELDKMLTALLAGNLQK